jgi:TM2 domain-containing membrane protein YozV
MMSRSFLFIVIVCFAAGLSSAQSTQEDIQQSTFVNNENPSNIILSGNLQLDNKISFDAVEKEIKVLRYDPQFKDKKSPWLGAIFSLILPGAGEFYAESYWKAGIFAALEAAVITTAVIYNNKGDDATNAFERFADNVTNTTGWSAVRYAEWLNSTYQASIPIDPNNSKPAWQRVNFDDIHAVEEQHSELSHQLAYYGEQQYYEMIGKYHQFRAGWADYTPELGFNVSPLFHEYTGMRATANDYYNTASKAVIGIYINHFLSAIDAYWSTTIYNKELVARVTVENRQYADYIELVPTLKLKLSF